METSILTSTKKLLGIDENYEVFDLDVITLINAAFSVVTQIGVGPAEGFTISDADLEWDDFVEDKQVQNLVKVYIHMKVRMLFDPPATGYLVEAMKSQLQEAEWRLNSIVDFIPVEVIVPEESI